MSIPAATARLQFHAGFTLDDGAAVVPYLARLGASHVYASPLLKARPGSTHGYDIVDHNEINPELGGMPALERLVAVLRDHRMGMILDIVPNHMGVGGADNAWWLDVLEWGEASPHAQAFDIDWAPPETGLRGKVLAPFLGAPYGEVLESGLLQLECDAAAGRLQVRYHEHVFPLSAAGTAAVLEAAPRRFADAIAHFAGGAALESRPEVARPLVETARRRLTVALATEHGRAGMDRALGRYDATNREGRARLHALLEGEHYRIAFWRAAADEINWRRFFDINMLAGIRVEIPEVFDASHRLIVELYARGLIDGVRVDHVDGLADPRAYSRKLRRVLDAAGRRRPPDAPGGPPYIVLEKILAQHERLHTDWLADGTTGYDFMSEVAGVLHDPAGEAKLSALWSRLSGRPADFETEERDARRQVLRDNLTSEWNGTAAAIYRVAQGDLATRDITLTAIRRALAEILVHFPVYRIYAGAAGSSAADRQAMDWALARAHRSFRAADRGLLDQVRVWLADASLAREPLSLRAARRRAMVRFQQLSSPVAAKSVEDTAFYRYGRLLSRNEVGGSPALFAVTPAAFHAGQRNRRTDFPQAMLATATHDHKRGEDVRARLAVLSEIPDEWEAALGRWLRLNAMLVRDLDSGRAPSEADEIMLYQTLVGAWPLDLDPQDAEAVETLRARVAGWWQKSIREAKLRSEWAAPDAAYEEACDNFLAGVLDTTRAANVCAEIAGFAARIAPAGAVNGLAQTTLKYTVPGVPDLYQGAEFWDLSLVDPDNRRPVDFAARDAAVQTGEAPADLLAAWRDGRVKQAVIARLLGLRRDHPTLFGEGDYRGIEAEGEAGQHVLAFLRRAGERRLLVAVSHLPTALLGETGTPLPPGPAYGDTRLGLDEEDGGDWHDALTGRRHRIDEGGIAAADLFARLPVAVLLR